MIMMNVGEDNIYIHRHDRIAQLICEKNITPEIQELISLLPQEEPKGLDQLELKHPATNNIKTPSGSDSDFGNSTS